jgi:hypothetical protein
MIEVECCSLLIVVIVVNSRWCSSSSYSIGSHQLPFLYLVLRHFLMLLAQNSEPHSALLEGKSQQDC